MSEKKEFKKDKNHTDKKNIKEKSNNKKDSRTDDRKEDVGYIEKLISVRRITKVVKGGKNLRFSALVVVGDGKGSIGYANAKAKEVPDAIKKAVSRAKKLMIQIPLKYGKTLHHDFANRVSSSRVFLRSAKPGTGVISGGSMRQLFEALGIQDVVSKSLGTNNCYNVIRSTFNALKMNESPRMICSRRGITVSEINHRRKVLLHNKWVEHEEVTS